MLTFVKSTLCLPLSMQTVLSVTTDCEAQLLCWPEHLNRPSRCTCHTTADKLEVLALRQTLLNSWRKIKDEDTTVLISQELFRIDASTLQNNSCCRGGLFRCLIVMKNSCKTNQNLTKSCSLSKKESDYWNNQVVNIAPIGARCQPQLCNHRKFS